MSNYWQRIALPAISPERGRYIERTQISANVEPDGKSPDSGFRTIEQSDRVCRTLSDSVESAPRGQREGPSENMCFQTWGHRAAVDHNASFYDLDVKDRLYRNLPIAESILRPASQRTGRSRQRWRTSAMFQSLSVKDRAVDLNEPHV